ncbi:hypothetical protein E1293_18930 [Actinomadura darangshiensis]|uniref:Thioredoxin n=1 Tax=Actinomadura darangshiensis TaxID=705336 RepID=A0A4R5B7K0_9ACTN|nr:hypothetical protein [Actinomadura darangshiensis]TDD81345.1 hypothetical protein E1293_18930 [Actinomadura darangshiensis]
MTLASTRHTVAGDEAAQDLFTRNGWGDGLPVVPPTPERVERFVAAAGLPAGQVIGRLPEQGQALTLEKIAVNAVAAGCREEYMSVLAATVRALTREPFNLHSTTVSGATAPLLIISGPVVDQLNVNTSFSLFGPGHHANATIGRAVRLILQNLCGGVPGVLDKATFGHPGKYTYCIGESRDLPDAWEPLHAERGVPAEQSAVTVFAGEAPVNARNDWASEPGPILATIADTMLPCHYTGGSVVVVLGPRHAAVMRQAGMGRADVRAELFRLARRSAGALRRAGRLPGAPGPDGEDEARTVVRRPEDILITVAGGDLYGYSAVIPYWVGGHESAPVTEALSAQETERCRIPQSRIPQSGIPQGETP